MKRSFIVSDHANRANGVSVPVLPVEDLSGIADGEHFVDLSELAELAGSKVALYSSAGFLKAVIAPTVENPAVLREQMRAVIEGYEEADDGHNRMVRPSL